MKHEQDYITVVYLIQLILIDGCARNGALHIFLPGSFLSVRSINIPLEKVNK